MLLTRSTSIPVWVQAIDPGGQRIQIRCVDYFDKAVLENTLQDVDTLISVTSAFIEAQAQIQINLLEAAIGAGCRRFIPSYWAMGHRAYDAGAWKIWEGGVWKACLKSSAKIEVTRINIGLFLNYLAYGILSPEMKAEAEQPSLEALRQGDGYASGGDLALEGLPFVRGLADGEGAFFVSLNGGIAEVPVKEDGSWPRLAFTTMRDVGRFTAAILELGKWEQTMNIVGDTLTSGELISLCERITKRLFKVDLWDPATIKGQLDALPLDSNPNWERLGLEFNYNYCKDEEGFGWSDPNANRLFPNIQPVKTADFLEQWWATVHGDNFNSSK